MESNKEVDELRSEEAFAELLGKAPPRPSPPVEDEKLIRAAVHEEWQQLTARHARRRRITSLALAASVLLAIIASLSLLRDPVGDFTIQEMAMIEKQFGAISVNGRIVSAGQATAIEGRDFVETGIESGIALGWHGGGSLRIDQDSSVVFEAANQIYLRSGRVYFDSETSPLSSRQSPNAAVELSIRTDHGVVRHLGTQFMTRVGAGQLIVSVREGVVSIDGDVTARASAGQQFAISESGSLSIDDTDGVEDWEWVERSTPAVNLDGRYVAEALAWVSRESGRKIRYASAEAETLANTERLRGDWNVEPSRAVRLFMMTVDLNARIEDEVIVVSED